LHYGLIPPPSASVTWIQAMETKLGNCGTVVTRTGPNRLSFTRKGTIGISAMEFFILADWLESPQFPRGLTTFLGTPERLPTEENRRLMERRGTNAPPGQ
jgi:hypothetical protein